MKFPLIIGLAVLPHLAIAESRTALQQLDASEYEVRQKAQSELADWLKKQPEEAPRALIAYSRKAQSPEVKNRIYLLLKDDRLLRTRVLSEEYGAPKGFVGVVMGATSVKVSKQVMGAVLVQSVFPGSPAENHGIKVGDKIWKIDGKPFSGTRVVQQEFQKRVTQKKAGEKVTLDLFRGDKKLTINLFLAARDVEIQRQSNNLQERRLADEKEQHYEEWLSEQLQR